MVIVVITIMVVVICYFGGACSGVSVAIVILPFSRQKEERDCYRRHIAAINPIAMGGKNPDICPRTVN